MIPISEGPLLSSFQGLVKANLPSLRLLDQDLNHGLDLVIHGFLAVMERVQWLHGGNSLGMYHTMMQVTQQQQILMSQLTRHETTVT